MGASVRVYVTPNKIYGNLLGSELISIYGIRRQKDIDTKSIEVKDNTIFIPSGYLDSESLETLKVIERNSGIKITSKRQPRAIKYYWNVTLTF
jgi:hypothetical protein